MKVFPYNSNHHKSVINNNNQYRYGFRNHAGSRHPAAAVQLRRHLDADLDHPDRDPAQYPLPPPELTPGQE